MIKNCCFKNKNRSVSDKISTLEYISIDELTIKLACICLDNKNSLSIFSQVRVYINIYIQTPSSMQIIYTLLDSKASVNFVL